MPGTLYILATPIGNLADLSKRVQEIFAKVDLILAEDTRVTIKLLNHLGIKKRMVSCHDYNEKSRLKLIEEFSALNQNIALVSDAGTPLISDPGSEIVRHAIKCGMNIVPIPGPSAGLLALIASGLPCERFVFEGFLPHKSNLLKKRLESLKHEERTIILYESPHRLLKTLTAINEILGDRTICIARELTKLHEEIIRGSLSTILTNLSKTKILGEFVIVIAGNNSNIEHSIDHCEIESAINILLEKGESVKTIVQTITKEYDLKRSQVYDLALRRQITFKEKRE